MANEDVPVQKLPYMGPPKEDKNVKVPIGPEDNRFAGRYTDSGKTTPAKPPHYKQGGLVRYVQENDPRDPADNATVSGKPQTGQNTLVVDGKTDASAGAGRGRGYKQGGLVRRGYGKARGA